MIVLVVVMLIITAANAFGGITVTKVGNAVNSYVSKLGRGEGYPYSFPSEQVKNVYPGSSDIILLTDVYARVLTPTAKTKLNVQHNFSAPAVASKGSGFILYDRDSKYYKVARGKSVSAQKEAAGNILTCAIGENGSYAVASRANDAASTVTVYDGNFNSVFKWNSSSDHIIDVALTDNGKFLSAAVIGAEKGEVVSKVLVFDVNSSEPLAQFKFPGAAAADIHFTSKGNLIIICDNMVTVIDKNKKDIKSQTAFDDDSLRFISVGSKGETAVMFSKFGSNSSGIIKFYSAKGDETASIDTKSAVYRLAARNNEFAVYYGGEIATYNVKGVEKARVKCPTDYINAFYSGGELYLCRSGKIDTLSSVKESNKG